MIEQEKWEKNTNNLISNAKENEEKELLLDLKYIVENSDNNTKYKNNLKKFEMQDNYPIDLKKLNIKNSENVLNLSINPGSSKKKYQKENKFNNKTEICMPLYAFNKNRKYYWYDDNEERTNKEISEKEINTAIKEIDEQYVWQRYYSVNTRIFDNINVKYPWIALDKDKIFEEFEKIVEDKNKLKILKNMYLNEREDFSTDDPLIFFNDLFWIADSDQKGLLNVLNNYNPDKEHKSINEFIKNMLDLYIEKYKLKLIVITNAKASDYIIKAIIDNDKEKDKAYKDTKYDYKSKNGKIIPIIFSGYIANGMDAFSVERLKKQIKDNYKS